MIKCDVIYTYGDGTPIEGRPDLPSDAGIEEKIAHMRAWNDYSGRVLDIGNAAFAKAFNEGRRSKSIETLSPTQ